MPPAAAERENPAKFSVRDLGGSICEPADILAGTQDAPSQDAWKQLGRRELSNIQSTLLRAPERGQIDSLGHR